MLEWPDLEELDEQCAHFWLMLLCAREDGLMRLPVLVLLRYERFRSLHVGPGEKSGGHGCAEVARSALISIRRVLLGSADIAAD